MLSFIIRVLGLKGSFMWACRQMEKGRIVKPKNIPGAVKYRFDTEGQTRIQYAFTHSLKNAEWENANIFMKDVLSVNWELWNAPKETEETPGTIDNNERDNICLECAGSGRRYFAYGTKEGVVCKWCEGTGKRSPIS